MNWARSSFKLLTISIYLLTAFLFSGCAAGPHKTTRSAEELTPQQQAQQAIEEEDYDRAVTIYTDNLNIDDKLEVADRYDYGIALSKTGRYEDAVEQLSIHIDAQNKLGANFTAALFARVQAERNLETKTKTEQAKANIKQLGEKIQTSWLLVQQQLESRPPMFTEPLTGIEMALITGGCYRMGDQFGDGKPAELPVHEVCIDDFYLGRHEVTQEQWLQIMGYNPSLRQQGGRYPVDKVSWLEAMLFAEALSGSKDNFRLPTEAEWEYAARSGGQKQKFSGSDNIDEVAWYKGNSAEGSHPVGQKQANGLELYDMSGNLFEWCLDRYSPRYYQQSPKDNPTGPIEGNEYVTRGGSWSDTAYFNRTSYRSRRDYPDARDQKYGFRLALSASEELTPVPPKTEVQKSSTQ